MSYQLEQMDRLSTQPGTRIAWSQQVDRIEAGPSVAVVNAILLEDTSRTPRIMRGLQIVLNGEGKRDRIYVSEEYSKRLISALDEVAPASPAQCEMADGWRGLSVSTGIETFRFTDIDASPLR
jgi:hypothetical protein